MNEVRTVGNRWRIFRYGLLLCLVLPMIYLAVFGLYFKAGWLSFDFLGRTVSLTIDRALVWLYTPCTDAEQAWEARQELEKAKAEYFRSWECIEGGALILPDGRFTIRYGEQTMRGVGRFAFDEDGRLHFTGDCDGDIAIGTPADEQNPQLLRSYEHEIPQTRRCRVWIRTYEGDDYTLQGAEFSIHAADDPNLLFGCGGLSPGR